MDPICIIPLRAGSKGFPNKNTKELCGKPLFCWVLDGQPLDYTFGCKPLRQNYAEHWVETGAFYASRVGALLESDCMTSAPVGLVEIGVEACIDIDELLDFQMAEGCAQHRVR